MGRTDGGRTSRDDGALRRTRCRCLEAAAPSVAGRRRRSHRMSPHLGSAPVSRRPGGILPFLAQGQTSFVKTTAFGQSHSVTNYLSPKFSPGSGAGADASHQDAENTKMPSTRCFLLVDLLTFTRRPALPTPRKYPRPIARGTSLSPRHGEHGELTFVCFPTFYLSPVTRHSGFAASVPP